MEKDGITTITTLNWKFKKTIDPIVDLMISSWKKNHSEVLWHGLFSEQPNIEYVFSRLRVPDIKFDGNPLLKKANLYQASEVIGAMSFVLWRFIELH